MFGSVYFVYSSVAWVKILLFILGFLQIKSHINKFKSLAMVKLLLNVSVILECICVLKKHCRRAYCTEFVVSFIAPSFPLYMVCWDSLFSFYSSFEMIA